MKTTRNLVDPELLAFVDAAPAIDLDQSNLNVVRERLASFGTYSFDGSDVLVETLEAQADHPRCLVFRPDIGRGLRPAILHIHGGGFVAGVPEIAADRNLLWSRDLGAVIVSVDYRKAPEYPFPAGLNDCVAALEWVRSNASRLEIDLDAIAVVGESAGAGLAASLALHERDSETDPFCLQLLISPMLDDRTVCREQTGSLTGEFVWTRASNVFAWRSYLGEQPGTENVSSLAAPARTNDLSNLPSTYIETGALDLFLEEGMDYAARLLAAGVSVELHVYPGTYHGFQRVLEARVTKASETNCLNALRCAFAAADKTQNISEKGDGDER